MQRAPPMMLPRVTGSRLLLKKCWRVKSAPAAIPKGIMNMLATAVNRSLSERSV